jgi:antirestriction protein ArdC
MDLQYNYLTGDKYEGRNQVELQLANESKKYKTDAWITFLQSGEAGLRIKKGSHGVPIMKRFTTVIEEKNGKQTERSAPTGYATVFNLDQTERL